MARALVLVDFQKEWIDEESEYFVGDITEILDRVNELISYCRKHRYKIIFTRHIDEDGTLAFAPHTDNVKIIARLDRKEKDVVITKYRVSPFFKTKLGKELEGMEEVVVCGILTNLCVRSMVEGAYDRDHNIIIIKNCCVAYDKQTQEFTLNDLKETREEIQIKTLNEFI